MDVCKPEIKMKRPVTRVNVKRLPANVTPGRLRQSGFIYSSRQLICERKTVFFSLFMTIFDAKRVRWRDCNTVATTQACDGRTGNQKGQEFLRNYLRFSRFHYDIASTSQTTSATLLLHSRRQKLQQTAPNMLGIIVL